jgi:ABC-type phosphate transport system substrate-binding protein
MSRPMTADEIAAFEKKYGYKPAHFRLAADALAVYVNKDNPIVCLTLQHWIRFSLRRAKAVEAGASIRGVTLA